MRSTVRAFQAKGACPHNLILPDYGALAITATENGRPLLIDHNIWWPGGGRIMKLSGTGRQNNGVQFLHNTYFTGNAVAMSEAAGVVAASTAVIVMRDP